jgi:hypothetical protein
MPPIVAPPAIVSTSIGIMSFTSGVEFDGNSDNKSDGNCCKKR